MGAARLPGLMIGSLFVAGCGCGDLATMQQVRITAIAGTSSAPMVIDVSQLPPGAIDRRAERTDSCGNPITELTITQSFPIKVVLVPLMTPATQPTSQTLPVEP